MCVCCRFRLFIIMSSYVWMSWNPFQCQIMVILLFIIFFCLEEYKYFTASMVFNCLHNMHFPNHIDFCMMVFNNATAPAMKLKIQRDTTEKRRREKGADSCACVQARLNMRWTLIVINVHHMWQSQISIFPVFSNWLLLIHMAQHKIIQNFRFLFTINKIRHKIYTFNHMVWLNCAKIFYWTRKATGRDGKKVVCAGV